MTEEFEDVCLRANKAAAELKAIQGELIDADIVRGRDFRALEMNYKDALREVALLGSQLTEKSQSLAGLSGFVLELEDKLLRTTSLLQQAAKMLNPNASRMLHMFGGNLTIKITEFLKDPK